MEGRCRIGSKRGGQQSPQQLRGLHGNLATDHLRAPVNTTLNVLWKLYLPMIPNWDGGGEGKQNVLAKQTSAMQKAHVSTSGTPHILVKLPTSIG